MLKALGEGGKAIFAKIVYFLFYRIAHEITTNLVKIQNSQNPIRSFVAGTIVRLYIKNQVNWSTFDGVITFSVEKAVPKSQREKRKKLPF